MFIVKPGIHQNIENCRLLKFCRLAQLELQLSSSTDQGIRLLGVDIIILMRIIIFYYYKINLKQNLTQTKQSYTDPNLIPYFSYYCTSPGDWSKDDCYW